MESTAGKTDAVTKGNIIKTKSMAMEYIYGQMVESMRDIGSQESSTVRVNTIQRQVVIGLVFGKMEREYSGQILKIDMNFWKEY